MHGIPLFDSDGIARAFMCGACGAVGRLPTVAMCSCEARLPEHPDGFRDQASARRLMHKISSLSEEKYCAGWMHDIEYLLWKEMKDRTRGSSAPSFYPMEDDDVAELAMLYEQAGGWWRWDDGILDKVFVPALEWETIYAEWEDNQK